MGRRDVVHDRDRGGARVPTLRATRARRLTAGASLALGAGLVAYAAVRAGRAELVPAGVGVLGLLLLVPALVLRLPSLVAWALGVLGAAYATALLLRGETIDPYAALYAVGLLLAGEFGYWSLELHLPADEGTTGRRLVRLALLALVGGGIASVVLAVSEAASSGGLLLEGLGVIAAGAALALVAMLARSARRRPGGDEPEHVTGSYSLTE